MKNTAHGHGDKGMAFYEYQDAEGVGIVMDARRESGRHPFVETWRFRWVPNIVFHSLDMLLAALRDLPDATVDAEKAKWPVMREAVRERSIGTGNCWLHTDKPGTHSGWLQGSWIESDCEIAMLCEDCAQQAQTDPMVIRRASEKRIADVAARHP